MTRFIVIANRKGGAGKSTCAAHLSMEAVKSGNSVILIDLDPQKTLEGWWEKRKEENPYMAEATINNLNEKIKTIREKEFDYCFIDTPGDTSLNTTEAIKVADIVVIPCKPTSPDLKAIGRTISMVQEDNKNFLFLLSQTIANSKAATQAAMVLSEFGTLITSSVSNRISYVNAMAIGDSATNLDSKATEELESIWKFLEQKLNSNKVQKNDKEKI